MLLGRAPVVARVHPDLGPTRQARLSDRVFDPALVPVTVDVVPDCWLVAHQTSVSIPISSSPVPRAVVPLPILPQVDLWHRALRCHDGQNGRKKLR